MTPSKLPILIVDDDFDCAAVLAMQLAASGYQADTAHSGAIALHCIDDTKYGIAIIDYSMPGMNGVELLRQMRKRHPELAAVFLTGYTTIDVVYPAVEAGVLRVLSKPADFQELLRIINEHAAVAV